MASGFPFKVMIGDTSLNWKTVRFSGTSPSLESSAKYLKDGTINTGYTSRSEDLRTFMCEADGQLGEGTLAGNEPVPPDLDLGEQSDVDWELSYQDVVIASGTGCYIEDYTYSGNIPGEARASIRFFSDGQWNWA